MTQEELKEVLRLHALWVDSDQGKRADLRYADLRGADLDGANLRYADLDGADLRYADLDGADLRYADLYGADLRDADLCGADLRDANLRGANLRDADLIGANLRDADLIGANLRDANLQTTTGNMREVKSLHLENYPITYTAESLQIGCERHPINCWWELSDDDIAEMEDGALEWWHKWKEPLRQIIELSPATPTKVD